MADNTNKQLTLSLHLLLLSAVIGFLLLPLFQRGMFSDGVAYATIARNMAMGVGSLKTPYFTSAVFPHFFEHPPLGLWLQSFFFKAFGDHYYTERLFCLAEIVITFFATAYLWRRSFRDRTMRAYYWVPIVLLMLNPLLVSNLYSNMLDSTVLCFGLLTTACLIDTARMGQWRYLACMLAASFILAGFLANGPVIFFTLTVPLLSSITRKDRSFKTALYETIVVVLTLAAMALCVFTLNPGLWLNIKTYISSQVLPSTVGNRINPDTVGLGRLLIVKKIVEKILPAMGLLVILLICRQIKLAGFNRLSLKRDAIFYLLLGLMASLPIALAHRQSSNYVLPAMPFFALAIVQYVTPAFFTISQKLNRHRMMVRVVFIASIISLSAALWLFAIKHGELKRDQAMITDIKIISAVVGEGNSLTAAPSITHPYWVLVGYFGRYSRINVVRDPAARYYLTYKHQTAPTGYHHIPLNTHDYSLYVTT
ncbi:MAG: glycosyltransferase family 39 protein [Coxiellaceae bacterium]|nr:glycosyltransferase family 39 protein [Coxiellaceae bacterium]